MLIICRMMMYDKSDRVGFVIWTIVATLTLVNATYESTPTTNPYKYEWPSPPYTYESSPHPLSSHQPIPSTLPLDFQAIVIGNVYCDICKNGKIKKPLKGNNFFLNM